MTTQLKDGQVFHDYMGASGVMANTETLTGTKTLIDTDAQIQYLDPGGAGRTVTLPAEGNDNHPFWIVNTADAAETLTVKDDAAATIVSVTQSNAAIVVSDGTTWKAASGGAVSGLYLYDRANDTVTVTGTTEGDLYSKAIAANVLGTTNGLRFTLIGTHKVQDGSTQTIAVKFGATTVFSVNYGGAVANGTYALKIVVEMFNTTATAQRWFFWTQATLGAPATALVYATSAEDTTAAKTLAVTEDSNNAAGAATKTIAFLEYLQ